MRAACARVTHLRFIPKLNRFLLPVEEVERDRRLQRKLLLSQPVLVDLVLIEQHIQRRTKRQAGENSKLDTVFGVITSSLRLTSTDHRDKHHTTNY